MRFKHMGHEQPSHIWGCIILVAWGQMDHLSQSVNKNHNGIITISSGWEIHYKIHTDRLPSFTRDRQRL